jgi:transposase
VADCKLASTENMAYIHQHRGRFLTVLPRTRSEDKAFRDLLANGQVQWRHIHDKRNDKGEIVDQYSVAEPPTLSNEGYRLAWYHSTCKAQQDAYARQQQVERATNELAELRQKLLSPRTRYRQETKVAEAVQEILRNHSVEDWIITEITEQAEEKYRQDGPGRPNEHTRYVKETSSRFKLEYRIDTEQLALDACGDGVFPLISNDDSLAELEMLLAYKSQPALEKRFSHLKTDFEVAPVYLKEVSRIQALLCVYFLALLTESLLERELRRAMDRDAIESLPMYPEGRKCCRPTARRLIDLFDDVQRHSLRAGRRPPVAFTTNLSRLQRRLLRLLGMKNVYND